MSKNNKTFPQTKLQEEIYEFWSTRGYPGVRAVLGNLSVSFHRDDPGLDDNGLCYQYLEQFYKKAQAQAKLEGKREFIIILKQLNTCHTGKHLLIQKDVWQKLKQSGGEDV